MTSAISWMNSFNLRESLNQALSDGNTVANYRPGVGVTGTLNASAWANQLGAAGSLAQATGASQPIVLPFTGSKYLSTFAINSNSVSTPVSAATGDTGDKDFIFEVAANDYTPAANNSVIGTYTAGDGWLLNFNTDGTLRFFAVGGVNVNSTAANGVTDGTKSFFRVKHDVDNGAGGRTTQFYKSTDFSWATLTGTWTQIGTDVVTATAQNLPASAGSLFVGVIGNPGTEAFNGKIYRVQMWNGFFDAGGTKAVEFNAADWSETSTNGATQVSSTTGETWTLNNTAIATPAAIVGSPFIVTNAVAHWMRATYTAAQPRTLYIVGMDPVWAAGQYIADGVTANTLGLSKTTSTPRISLNAGAAAAENAGFTLRAKHILTIGLNGASSFTTVDGGTPVTGDPGAGDPGGLTIGADGGTPTAGSYGGFWYSEIIDRNGADSAATQSRIQSLLRAIHGTP